LKEALINKRQYFFFIFWVVIRFIIKMSNISQRNSVWIQTAFISAITFSFVENVFFVDFEVRPELVHSISII
jgi:hypothetical protein